MKNRSKYFYEIVNAQVKLLNGLMYAKCENPSDKMFVMQFRELFELLNEGSTDIQKELNEAVMENILLMSSVYENNKKLYVYGLYSKQAEGMVRNGF